MDKLFEGYGEAKMDQSGWCPDHAICMDWIEKRAVNCMENFIEADSVYMSNDVYADFIKQMAQRARYSASNSNTNGQDVIRIMTSIGTLTVKRIPILSNFCYVGTQTSADRLVWEKVSQDFEEAFFGEGS